MTIGIKRKESFNLSSYSKQLICRCFVTQALKLSFQITYFINREPRAEKSGDLPKLTLAGSTVDLDLFTAVLKQIRRSNLVWDNGFKL